MLRLLFRLVKAYVVYRVGRAALGENTRTRASRGARARTTTGGARRKA